MKNFLVLSLLMTVFFTTNANSALITTTFLSNNGQSGNMFDVVTLGGAVNITGFDLNLDSGTWGLEIYTKSGTWVGSENNSSAWNLIDTGTILSSGLGNASFFNVTDFILGATSTNALYITVTNGTGMNYTNGSAVGNVASGNSDLQILEGAGKAYAFSNTYQPRIWNGTIYYNTTISVPEPTSIILLGLGLAGLGFSKIKKRT